MTIFTMPTVTGIQTSRFELEVKTRNFESAYSFATQTLALPGARWRATFQLPAMRRAKAEVWLSFLMKLRGQSGRFYGYDPDAIAPRGSAGGTPIVNGGGQSGRTLNTQGWPASQPAVLKEGDYFCFDAGSTRSLHKLTADAASNGSGQATLQFEPAIRISPAGGAAITVNKASCIMMLGENITGADADQQGIYRIGFSALEVYQ